VPTIVIISAAIVTSRAPLIRPVLSLLVLAALDD
jgi:hypothetical protein